MHLNSVSFQQYSRNLSTNSADTRPIFREIAFRRSLEMLRNALYSQDNIAIRPLLHVVCNFPHRQTLGPKITHPTDGIYNTYILNWIAASREFHIYLSIWRGTHAEITTTRARLPRRTQKGWSLSTHKSFISYLLLRLDPFARTLLAVGVSRTHAHTNRGQKISLFQSAATGTYKSVCACSQTRIQSLFSQWDRKREDL